MKAATTSRVIAVYAEATLGYSPSTDSGIYANTTTAAFSSPDDNLQHESVRVFDLFAG